MALMFVAIALFVGVMVIANTFAILFAQRMRDFALLRCVGVTRRQLRRAVRLEALVLGLVALDRRPRRRSTAPGSASSRSCATGSPTWAPAAVDPTWAGRRLRASAWS